ncbi:MAG: protein kinase [Anaerolineales bacterium]|jgi:serine/threonine protein kinase|nr:protein kinase [Anaerolineales bacterium]
MAQNIGKYEILEKLGEGASSDVYRARDTQLGRVVALKVLKPALVPDSSAFARFIQEAQAAAGLFHPNIATVLDMGEADGRYFIAMRYLPGQSLDHILREQGPLSWEKAVRMAGQIGAALDYAHKEGFLHRDVKPSNIICTPENAYVLTDFGLVRAMMSTGLTSHTGAVLGTPAYIAPEIWLSEPAVPATDQYALACVVYEALTGKVLFAGDTPPAIMTRHVLKGAELPIEWPEGVPAIAEGVLARALVKNPNERYTSLGDFIKALQDLNKTPKRSIIPNAQKVEIVSPARPTQSDFPRLPWLSWFTSFLLLVASAALGYVVGLYEGEAIFETPIYLLNWIFSLFLIRLFKDFPHRMFVFQLTNAVYYLLFTKGVLNSYIDYLDFIGFNVIGWLISALVGGFILTRKLKPGITARMISLNRLFILAVTLSGIFFVVFIGWAGWWWGNGKYIIHTLKNSRAPVDAISFSPGSFTLAVASIDEINFWDTKSGDLKLKFQAPEYLDFVNYINNAALAAGGSFADEIYYLDIVGGDIQIREEFSQDEVLDCLVVSPNGKLAATGSRDDVVYIWGIPDGMLVNRISSPGSPQCTLAFSPDSSVLASGSDDEIIRLWNIANGELLQTLHGHSGAITSVAFSPVGGILASGSEDATIRLWRISDGISLETIKGHSKTVNDLAFSPGGSILVSASADKTIKLWNMSSGISLNRTLWGFYREITLVEISPDGKLLATAAWRDGQIRLWDMERLYRIDPAMTAPESDIKVPTPLGDLWAYEATLAPKAEQLTTEAIPTTTPGVLLEPELLVAAQTAAASWSPPPIPETYMLQKGEPLYCLARRFNLNPAELLAINGIGPSTIIAPGTILKLPQTSNPFVTERYLIIHPTTYAVQEGDNIYTIACQFGDVYPEAIAFANSLQPPYPISAGQALYIP